MWFHLLHNLHKIASPFCTTLHFLQGYSDICSVIGCLIDFKIEFLKQTER